MAQAWHNRAVQGAVWIGLGLACAAGAGPVSSATNRPALGAERTPFLRYDSSLAFTNAQGRVAEVTNVQVAGTWDVWTGRYGLAKSGENLWELDVRTLNARLGQHEFRFIVNGEWETGANRVMPVNLDGEIEQPPAI
ncbi:MAG: glycogen-binding domain-containing protein, partial [Kiritimatiellae bacterium]|nr:glycogen-binding domain-containing protein [Kiritimatiellia bacterium]